MISLQKLFGKDDRFFRLLDASAEEGRQSVRSLKKLLADPGDPSAAREMELARQKERETRQEISAHLIKTFVTSLEREDIEALGSALYKIPKQVEKFADRYSLAVQHLDGIDFAPRAAMLEQAASVVVEMVHDLKKMNIDRMTELNEKLRALENEADRLMLELYRDIYSGRLDNLQMFLLKEFLEILEKAIDRCREAGVVAYQIVLKNS